ncbi:hypothetical protein EEA58_15475 [Salmonella enterica subsp. enterica serovar Oslo]|nr:hypothetical protein [Salmonella enterica subsp. enterica serovar Oslo]
MRMLFVDIVSNRNELKSRNLITFRGNWQRETLPTSFMENHLCEHLTAKTRYAGFLFYKRKM